MNKGLQLFNKWANERGPITVGNRTYTWGLQVLDDGGNLATLVSNAQRLHANSSINFLVGPIASDFNIAVATRVTEPARRILVAVNAAADDFYTNFTHFYSLSPTASTFAVPALLEMRVSGAKTISVVTSDIPISIQVCSTVPRLATGYNVEVKSFDGILDSITEFQESHRPNLTATVDKLMAVKSDVILICAYPPQVKFMVDLMKTRNYLPKLIVVNNLLNVNFDDYENKEYLAGLSQWDPSARFPTDDYFGTGADLLREWRALFGDEEISSPAAHGLYAGIVIREAILRAKSLDNDLVEFQIKRMDLSTLKGRLAWSGDNRQIGTSVFVQYVNGSLRCVGPVLAATDRMIYPVPTFPERIPNNAVFALAVEYVMTALQILGICSNIFFFIFLLRNWNEQIIRASSPVFLSFLLLGSTLLYAQPWTMMPSVVTAAACHLRPWLLAVGFGLLFGALFSRTWRVWRLFSNAGVTIFKITDAQLGLGVFLVVGIEVVLCILISSVSNPMPQRIVVDPLRPLFDYTVCSANTAWFALIAVLGAYNLLIMSVGVYLAIRIRVIPYSLYNEAKIIGFAIYNTTFFSILIAVVYASAATDRGTVYGVCTAFQVVGTLLTTGLMFVSKMNMLRNAKERSRSSGNSSGRRTGTTAGTTGGFGQPNSSGRSRSGVSSTSGTDYTKLKQKYRDMKKENQKLRERLGLDPKAPIEDAASSSS